MTDVKITEKTSPTIPSFLDLVIEVRRLRVELASLNAQQHCTITAVRMIQDTMHERFRRIDERAGRAT